MIRRYVLAALVALSTANPVAAETRWIVDHAASALGFSVPIGGRDSEGSFENWQATIDFDPQNPGAGQVNVTVDIASVTIDAPQAAAAIAAPDWLGVIAHPQASFHARGLVWKPSGDLTVPGTLTLKGVTADLVLSGTLTITDGQAVAALRGTIPRAAFGVGTPDPAVGPEVQINVLLHATTE